MNSNPIDTLVRGINATEQTSSNIQWYLFGSIILLIMVIITYKIGKYYQKKYELMTWWNGIEKFAEQIADKQASTEAILQAFILQYSELIKLADLFSSCFYRPLYIGYYYECGIIYYHFQFAGVKSEFRNRSKCILFVTNTVRRFFQDVRCGDCGGVYVKILTNTELCFGIAGNRYGAKQIAPFLEAQQRKLEKDMFKDTL